MNRYLFLGLIFFAGCVTVNNNQTAKYLKSNTVVDGKLYTSVWMQRAAEYKALCAQAYNIAAFRLEQYIQNEKSTKPFAIITDIDETFLDNSPNSVHQALQGKDFEQSAWDEWVNKAAADKVVGALNFFQFAASKNVTVFYITNRNEKNAAATLKNLQKFHFPDADKAHLLVMTNGSSKEARRLQIEKDYDVALFLGDNLGDFSSLFDKKTEAERTANVLNNEALFGKKYIILPNPNYGDWEGAMYHYNYKLSPEQKDSIFKANARTY